MTRLITSVALLFILVTNSSAQQAITPEELAFNAVSAATNPASRMAAAEDFVANFPKSAKREHAARLVADQLSVLRNPATALTLLDRARAIFTSPAEWAQLKPVAVDLYLNADRVDDAFSVAVDILASKPNEFWVLVKLTNLGAKEARNKNLKYAEVATRYGLRAIEILEHNDRQPGLSDEQWASQKSQLPLLYQQVAMIRLAEGNSSETKEYLNKAIALAPQDPSNFALLGRVLNSDYESRNSTYSNMPEGNTRVEEKKGLDALIDRIIDAYAHAAGLATGKARYQVLLQQLIPDLTRLYRFRNNQSTAGLQQLIDKYRQ